MTEDLIQRGQDSSFKHLKEFLKDLLIKDSSEKVTSYSLSSDDTLNYLKEHLQKEWYESVLQSIVLIHGGMPLGEDENEEGCSKL